jgi:predicted RNA binding protein YcfA (HicA-like mRNA interferase family)
MAKTLSSREIIRLLKDVGWKEVRVTSSHRHFRHPSRPGTVTVPHPVQDMPPGTPKSIERQGGVKLR